MLIVELVAIQPLVTSEVGRDVVCGEKGYERIYENGEEVAALLFLLLLLPHTEGYVRITISNNI